ncbi:hypothetical protein Tco_0902196 [Tanacetum coccineum]
MIIFRVARSESQVGYGGDRDVFCFVEENEAECVFNIQCPLLVMASCIFSLNSVRMARRPIHSGDDWEFLARQNLDQAFFDSINTNPFSGPQWGNLFCMNEPIYPELAYEFFASFEFKASACRDNATLNRLSKAETVKPHHLLMEFWPTIGDGRLQHSVLAFSKYLKGVREKNLIYGGMFVTRIARSFGLLTNKMWDALSIEPSPHVFKKKSLIAMGVIMELQNGMCVWPTTRAVEEEEEAEEEAEGEVANEGAGGSANLTW